MPHLSFSNSILILHLRRNIFKRLIYISLSLYTSNEEAEKRRKTRRESNLSLSLSARSTRQRLEEEEEEAKEGVEGGRGEKRGAGTPWSESAEKKRKREDGIAAVTNERTNEGRNGRARNTRKGRECSSWRDGARRAVDSPPRAPLVRARTMCPLYPESRGFVASRPSESGECPLRSSSSSSSSSADRFVICSVLGYTATFLARFHRPRSPRHRRNPIHTTRSRVSIRESKRQQVLLLGIPIFRYWYLTKNAAPLSRIFFKTISDLECRIRGFESFKFSCSFVRYSVKDR